MGRGRDDEWQVRINKAVTSQDPVQCTSPPLCFTYACHSLSGLLYTSDSNSLFSSQQAVVSRLDPSTRPPLLSLPHTCGTFFSLLCRVSTQQSILYASVWFLFHAYSKLFLFPSFSQSLPLPHPPIFSVIIFPPSLSSSPRIPSHPS